MSVRDDIWRILTNDPDLTAELPAEHIHGSGSLEQAPDHDRFIVIRMDDETSPFPNASAEDVQIWVHDRGGSLVWIDNLLPLVKAAMKGAPAEGEFIAAYWQGNSGDQPDDVLNTNTRHVDFRIAKKA